ncbi:hypothetical protein ACPOL_7061 (plasmid) [Acidisarcina polymorpha]|uniref:Uncharacterized protein n=1 Tax=Acidisarcina polymorpha TaxID=2211140 RepID=A0A2Z5GB87_9BACT|nr:hypothetical protein ACPOL_7061 [Acidisarcina polymorpha]
MSANQNDSIEDCLEGFGLRGMPATQPRLPLSLLKMRLTCSGQATLFRVDLKSKEDTLTC